MHLEILVEDQSGKAFLDIAIPRMIQNDHTFRVHAYKGIGRIPRNVGPIGDIQKRMLLDQLPRLLRGYGAAFANYGSDYEASVIVVCDLDEKNPTTFHAELMAVLESCVTRPNTTFAFAVEEGEAWLLGDIAAIKKAYPTVRERVLTDYVNDSICGTWEKLADAVCPGGSQALSKKGWQAIGLEKSQWAVNIAPHMDLRANKSPSFRRFYDTVQLLSRSDENVE